VQFFLKLFTAPKPGPVLNFKAASKDGSAAFDQVITNRPMRWHPTEGRRVRRIDGCANAAICFLQSLMRPCFAMAAVTDQ
jgi:hypothetical protein